MLMSYRMTLNASKCYFLSAKINNPEVFIQPDFTPYNTIINNYSFTHFNKHITIFYEKKLTKHRKLFVVRNPSTNKGCFLIYSQNVINTKDWQKYNDIVSLLCEFPDF